MGTKKMEKLSIVKIGGNIIENEQALQKFLSYFAAMEHLKILVHGGGKKADQVLKKMGLKPKMVNGRRITDAESLSVAIMVYGGLTNKTIVSKLQQFGCDAIGMSGADANTIKAHKRPVAEIDYGFAGDVEAVDAKKVSAILNIGLTPVFCALTHDQNGQLLNTNADTIAAEMAIAMSQLFETTLFYCFELNGVLADFEDKSSVIKKIDSYSYQKLIDDGIIAEGMLPKMQNCFHALEHGVNEVRIGNLALFEKESTNYTTLVL
ncbi:acetylglutamate kinase [uncultured Croceitalea sp.]|uniref:acetylglutamate kinase n=1 Tax=uncultured Croceitalea sp. TaxID=1798908 RepID=UPI003305C3D9